MLRRGRSAVQGAGYMRRSAASGHLLLLAKLESKVLMLSGCWAHMAVQRCFAGAEGTVLTEGRYKDTIWEQITRTIHPYQMVQPWPWLLGSQRCAKNTMQGLKALTKKEKHERINKRMMGV